MKVQEAEVYIQRNKFIRFKSPIPPFSPVPLLRKINWSMWRQSLRGDIFSPLLDLPFHSKLLEKCRCYLFISIAVYIYNTSVYLKGTPTLHEPARWKVASASWRELTDLYFQWVLLLMFLPLRQKTHKNCFLLFITQGRTLNCPCTAQPTTQERKNIQHYVCWPAPETCSISAYRTCVSWASRAYSTTMMSVQTQSSPLALIPL